MPIQRRIQTVVTLDGVPQESNIIFHEMETRGDWTEPLPDGNVFVLRDLWPQVNGSAETWPQWAQDEYLEPWGDPCGNDSAGGETHLFAVSYGTNEQCGVVRGKSYIAWTDGFDKLGTSYNGYVTKRADQTHGWVNWFDSNGYYPDQGQRGPWCWCPVGLTDVVDGGGLPYNRHVSWFGVWERMTYAEYLAEKADPVEPPIFGAPDVEFAKAIALSLSTQFVAMRNDENGIYYEYMQPEEVVGRATEIERLLRTAYEE